MNRSTEDVRRPAASFLKRYLSKRMLVMLGCVGAILVLIFGYVTVSGLITARMMRSMVQATTVATTSVQKTMWQTQLQAVGSLHAVHGADLAAESSGIVTRIAFVAGQDVKKGQLLVQLRDDSERADAEEALRTYKRDAELIKTNAVSQSDYDTAVANMKSTKAAVEEKVVRAPYDGRVGIRQVDLGAYVSAGTTMVTLQQLDPIYVDFKVAQQQLPYLAVGGKVTFTTDVLPGKTFSGEIEAFDPKVDEDTRTITVRALIHNPKKTLMPGMFGTTIVLAGAPQSFMTLPQTVITYNTYGNVVYVVKKETVDGKEQLVADQRFVTTGETRGDQVAILSGLKSTDVVVSSGTQKIKNGSILTINNAVSLPNDSNPHPKNGDGE